MDEDLIADELEFRADMAELHRLVGEIYWRRATQTPIADSIRADWEDIRMFGNDPVFCRMLFDRMLAEGPEH